MYMYTEHAFEAYLDQGERPAQALAYLRVEVFPALDALQARASRCRRAQLWLTASQAMVLAALALLLLLPYPLPEAALRLSGAALALAAAGILFVQLLLRLPARGLDCQARAQRLSAVARAYLLGVGIFTGLDEDESLERLCAETGPLLHPAP